MKDGVKRELIALAEQAGAEPLKAETIVTFARDPQTALHAEFEWDDAKAAAEHRLNQARELVRVYVTVLPSSPQPVRGFLSVPTDRLHGGGYRRTEDVLKNDALRLQMIEDVLKRAASLKTSGSYLPELQPFFAEIEAAILRQRNRQIQVAAA